MLRRLRSLLALAPLCVAAPAAAELDPHWHHGAFMEIFVRAYQDSDGDGVGDLRGLISRLDYLKALGVRGLWLMPVSPSADRDHGYATTDYRGIESAYGSEADFKALLDAAHARGIGIITDYVINHSAAEHPFFVDARQGPASRYRDWYVWSEPKPEGWKIWDKDPWYPAETGHYFATFGANMPDFNLKNPAVVDYHFKTLQHWLDLGIDGFRIDAVPHMIENSAQEWQDTAQTRALARRMTEMIRGDGSRYAVCEATADPRAYAEDTVCGSAFVFGWDFPVAKAALGDAESIAKLATWFTQAPRSMGTMVSNHDIFAGKRLWDQVAGDERRYKLAAATYLLQPGRPFIYYGEEVGMAGNHQLAGDKPLRTPMSWNASVNGAGFTSGTPFRPLSPNHATHNAETQAQRQDSLLAFYKAMLALRNTRASLARGDYAASHAAGQTLHYLRRQDGETTLVAFNYSTRPQRLNIRHLGPAKRLRTLYPKAGSASAIKAGSATLKLPPLSVRVFAVD